MTQETTTRPQTSAREQNVQRNRAFLEAIQGLYEPDRGKIAALKRNAGNTLSEARGLAWFYFYLQRHFSGRDDRDNNLCLLVASLMTFDRSTMRNGLEKTEIGDFGRTLFLLRSPEEQAASRPGQTPLERRLVGLLDAAFNDEGGGEMAFRLRQAAKFAMQKEARIDWPLLLEDLRFWSYPDKFVQKRWARSFYAVKRSDDETTKE
jgi:CRISPR system Cascade subunit CasB